jgi:tetratricopeptide (TPR) repeat protein
MSDEITPSRPPPSNPDVQTASERDLSDLRREVIESRNLVIKTDNLLKNLHAELKQMGRKQEMFERRHWMTSVVAYVLFAVLASAGAFGFARSEIRSAREEAAANDGKVKQLTQEVESLRKADGVRRDASEKAARAYDLLGSEKEGPGLTLAMEQALRLDRQQISRLEARAIDDRSAGLKVKMAQSALERGNAAFRRNDWQGTITELGRYVELEPKVEDGMIWFRLGNALTQSKEYAKAVAPLENYMKTAGTTKTAQYGGYLLGTAYEATGNTDKAKVAYERAAALYPGTDFATMIRNRLRRLGVLTGTTPPAAAAQAAPAPQQPAQQQALAPKP